MAEKHLTDGTTALARQPRVIKIEAAEKPQNVQLRVAAYTRVSSDSDDQLNSFAAQNRYYAELISGKAEWRMVDIYADEGITGTSAAKREDFQRMMADCRRGLIDQILVKSISRFARNTKDCLEAVRELKELGVNVRFEREGIDTANVSSELITAIYAAFAQKESESISGNMRWSYQRRMESGEFNTCRAPWGFRLDGKRGASNYWAKLKQRLKEEGADQLLTNCQQLKMKSPKDGKRYNTDVADTEQLLRIVQSIPSPKAEPFRAWLAQVGRERIEETIDPELTIERALETYLKKGYTREWINQRLQAIQVRKELTDEWDARGVQKGVEYAILTDEISRAWSWMSTRQYKNLKGLKKENLRDNMTTLELVLNMLAEATTTQFSKDRKPTTFQENLEVAKAGGQVAGRTRKDIESQSNTPVISPKNAAQLNQVVTDLLEGAAADMSEMPEEK